MSDDLLAILLFLSPFLLLIIGAGIGVFLNSYQYDSARSACLERCGSGYSFYVNNTNSVCECFNLDIYNDSIRTKNEVLKERTWNLVFWKEGTQLVVCDKDDKVTVYSLSEAWEVSTAVIDVEATNRYSFISGDFCGGGE